MFKHSTIRGSSLPLAEFIKLVPDVLRLYAYVISLNLVVCNCFKFQREINPFYLKHILIEIFTNIFLLPPIVSEFTFQGLNF